MNTTLKHQKNFEKYKNIKPLLDSEHYFLDYLQQIFDKKDKVTYSRQYVEQFFLTKEILESEGYHIEFIDIDTVKIKKYPKTERNSICLN